MRYVVAYDVVDDARRDRLARFLLGWGRRVQKSVYEVDLTARELAQVREGVERLLRIPPDRVHIYALCHECASKRLNYGGDLEPDAGPVVVV